jgi:hypothetical protein
MIMGRIGLVMVISSENNRTWQRGSNSRQPGYLFETRGFPSPSHDGFGIR